MTQNEVIVALASGGSLITTLVLRWLDKRKHQAEASTAEAQLYEKLLSSVKTELESRDITISQLRQREINNEINARRQNEEIKKLRQQNRICEENNIILKAEIDWMRRMLDKQLGDYERMGVFVLDDSQIVTMSFKSKLEKSSIIDVQVFNDAETFAAAVLVKKPKLLIIDYYLKAGKTAEQMIDAIKAQPDYSPCLIIMSKDDREELKDHLHSKGISKFYLKEGLYQFDIVKYVMKYAETILS